MVDSTISRACRRSRGINHLVRLGIATLAIVSVACVAAATGASGAAAHHAAGACAKAETSTAATATRVGGTGTSSFGRVRRTSSTPRARSLARTLCALPRMPAGVFHCPFDSALSYVIRFAAHDRTVVTATVDPAGCQVVQGLVYPRTVSKDPGFWHVLGVSLGLAHASLATFRG
jgi:hypothetical protein